MFAEKMDGICEKYNLENFHIIGHSMGGLVAKRYIQNAGHESKVKSLITLGTPHHGTPTALLGIAIMGAGILSRTPFQMLPSSSLIKELNREHFPLDIPLTSIFSRQDFVCPWWASTLRSQPKKGCMENIQLKGIGHSELTSHPLVYREILNKLKQTQNHYLSLQQRKESLISK